MSKTNRIYVGVDGCPGGWFYLALDDKWEWECGVIPALQDILTSYPQAQVVLIDMPIGLRESGEGERACDRAARKQLGRVRASSVFPVPVRAALQAADYDEAKSINRRLTGKGMTIQTWNILPKLRELDNLMQQSSKARQCLREAHPEVCFRALNGGRTMQHNKKTLEGRCEREAVLRHYFSELPVLLAYTDSQYRRKELGRDDTLDAAVLAVTAKLGQSSLQTLPDLPEKDATGLLMEIVYYEP